MTLSLSIVFGWLILAIIVGLLFGRAVEKSQQQEIDEHEQMTIANYDNRSHWDM